MKALFLIINKIEKVDDLIHEFANHQITGATIINSTGMMHQLLEDDESSFLSLRNILNPQRKENKTIIMVVKEEKIPEIIALTESVLGSLDNPDTGIVFSIDVDLSKGLTQWK